MTLLHRIAHPHSLALFALSYILFLHGQCHNSFVFFSLLAIHCTLRFYQCKLCSEDISVRKSRLIKMNLIEILEHEKKVEHLFLYICSFPETLFHTFCWMAVILWRRNKKHYDWFRRCLKCFLFSSDFLVKMSIIFIDCFLHTSVSFAIGSFNMSLNFPHKVPCDFIRQMTYSNVLDPSFYFVHSYVFCELNPL